MSFFNYDQIHSVPKFEIYVEESLNFTVPVEHELYSLYKQSVKNITLSNLVSCLSSHKLCPGQNTLFLEFLPSTKHLHSFFKPNTIVLQVVKN